MQPHSISAIRQRRTSNSRRRVCMYLGRSLPQRAVATVILALCGLVLRYLCKACKPSDVASMALVIRGDRRRGAGGYECIRSSKRLWHGDYGAFLTALCTDYVDKVGLLGLSDEA